MGTWPSAWVFQCEQGHWLIIVPIRTFRQKVSQTTSSYLGRKNRDKLPIGGAKTLCTWKHGMCPSFRVSGAEPVSTACQHLLSCVMYVHRQVLLYAKYELSISTRSIRVSRMLAFLATDRRSLCASLWRNHWFVSSCHTSKGPTPRQSPILCKFLRWPS